MALTKAKLIELIGNGDIDVGGGGGVNANLLHNWDFRNPVNQRGVSGTVSGANVYSVDRWKNPGWGGDHIISVGSIGNGGELVQRIENYKGLEGKVVTQSFCISGVIYSATYTIPTTVDTSASEVVSIPPNLSVTCRATLTSAYLEISFGVNASLSGWEMVKLELGPVSTLHLDPPMEYGTELLKCQRYLKRFEGDFARMVSYVPDVLYFSMIQATAFRITPTLVGSCSVYTTSGALHTGFTVTADYTAYGTFMMLAQKTAHGLTDARLWANPEGVFLLSAEL